MADPNAIAASFLSEFCQTHFRLDGTICLVDAKYIDEIRKQVPVAQKQLTFADVILINKVDLIEDNELAELIERIKSANRFAKVIETIHGDYGDEDLVNLRAYEIKGLEESLSRENFVQLGGFSVQHDEIESLTFEFDVDFDPQFFSYGMNVLLEASAMDIFRIKGILAFEGEKHKVIFQSVMSSGVAALGDEWSFSERRKSRLVIIGKKLDNRFIDDIILNCLVREG